MSETKNTLQAGFARVDITPPLGTPLAGHPHPEKRLASEILDGLDINALAVCAGGRTALLLSADLLYIRKDDMACIRTQISEATGVPFEAIFIACTHTHTGPVVSTDVMGDLSANPQVVLYKKFLSSRFCDVAKLAIADLKPAMMGYAVTELNGVSFIRRYHMKDGTIRTNPGYHNPDIVAPVSQADKRVNVLRFVRKGGKDIALANFGVHADMLRGGTKVSADYPRFFREAVEAVMDVHCLYFTGAQGDLNHADFMGVKEKQVPFVIENDDIDRGYNFPQYINAKHMGRAVAGALLQVFADVQWVDIDTVSYGNMDCIVPTNMPDPADLPRARQIMQWHKEGRDDLIGQGNIVTTIRAEAQRMLNLEHGPETDTLPVSAVRIGPAVFVGIPGEPFNGIGVGLKANSPFDITLPCCLVNGAQGYYPMQDSYDEGGYEARSSFFAPGVAERLIETGTQLINSLK